MHIHGSIIIEKWKQSLQKHFSKHFEMKYIKSHCRLYCKDVSAAHELKLYIVVLHHYAGFVLRYLYFWIILQVQIWSCRVILFQSSSQPGVLKHDWLHHGNGQLIFGWEDPYLPSVRKQEVMPSIKALNTAESHYFWLRLSLLALLCCGRFLIKPFCCTMR